MSQSAALKKSEVFATRFGLSIPIMLAPMAGACPPELSIAVARAGGMGACGALLMSSEDIQSWAAEVRSGTNGSFQLNTWIPDPEPERNVIHESAVRSFLSEWGPDVPAEAADIKGADFASQCDAMISARPQVMSSIMGLYPDAVVRQMKQADIAWFATVTTVEEARAAEDAGADVVVAQGMEAGGHRGTFNGDQAESSLVGLFSLLPAVVDAVSVPVVATGGIADSRGACAALILGASAVQIGSGFLRTTEAGLASAWTAGMKESSPEAIQRNLTAAMRAAAVKDNDLRSMQAWAGQSAALASEGSAKSVLENIWDGMQQTLG